MPNRLRENLQTTPTTRATIFRAVFLAPVLIAVCIFAACGGEAVEDMPAPCSVETDIVCDHHCVDGRTDRDNCGQCGVVCQGAAVCVDSRCQLDCGEGYHTCPNGCMPNDSVAACVDLCSPCPGTDNGVAVCLPSGCDVVCNAGFHQCGNACERDDNADRCGLECLKCDVPKGGLAACITGECAMKCPDAQALCDEECIPVADGAKCDVPEILCPAAIANGEYYYLRGKCELSCDAGYHPCGETDETMTCTDDTAVATCGGRCEPCDAPEHGTPVCTQKQCDFVCDHGFHKAGKYCAQDTWAVETIASIASSWGPTAGVVSLAVDSHGEPHVVFAGGDSKKVFYAVHSASGWASEVVGDTESNRVHASLVLDKQDRPHIAFASVSRAEHPMLGSIRYAARAETGWNIETIASAACAWRAPSIAVGDDGVLQVAFRDDSDGTLKYAARGEGGSWPLESVGGVSWWSRLILDARNTPHLILNCCAGEPYSHATRDGDNGAWTYQVIDDPTGYCKGNPSLAFDGSGKPQLVYSYHHNSGTVGCISADGLILRTQRGDRWTSERVDVEGVESAAGSFALGMVGRPLVAYLTSRGLTFGETVGARWRTETVETLSAEEQTFAPTLALDSSGRPHLAYPVWHNTEGGLRMDVKYAKLVATRSAIVTWGSGQYGQLDGVPGTTSATPVRVDLPAVVIDVAAGIYHSLALAEDGRVWRWGVTDYDGWNGTTFPTSVPTLVTTASGEPLSSVVAVVSREAHTVALRNDGTVWAWGGNWYGQLGDGTTSRRLDPVQVVGREPDSQAPLTDVKAIEAGYKHTLALAYDGSVLAWGDNHLGQLGNGTTNPSYRPVLVQGLSDVIAIASGYIHSVALTADGRVWTWGGGMQGQLGDFTSYGSWRLTPQAVFIGARTIAAGGHSTFVITNDGEVWGWGLNEDGQLGDGTLLNRPGPTRLPNVPLFSAIAIGHGYTVAETMDGSVWTWGQIPTGTGVDTQLVPIQVSGLLDVRAVANGSDHTVALRAVVP